MQNNGDTIDPALRIVAYSMEEGNWDLVEWMIDNHESQELGPYFLPAIAQVSCKDGCVLRSSHSIMPVYLCQTCKVANKCLRCISWSGVEQLLSSVISVWIRLQGRIARGTRTPCSQPPLSANQ